MKGENQPCGCILFKMTFFPVEKRIYIYIYICVCVCMYIYIYIYISIKKVLLAAVSTIISIHPG